MNEVDQYPVPSKRILLSWYIDFLLFMVIWSLLNYFFNDDNKPSSWSSYFVFLVIRAFVEKNFRSIGDYFLGINKTSQTVNPNVYERENWLTILFGVLFILEGSKQLVRWTQISVTQPVFGFFPEDNTQIIIHVVSGLFCLQTGYWFLKLDIKGLILGILILLLNIVSDLVSWNLWGPVVVKKVLARHEITGLPVREGEVEFMQIMIPGGMVLAAIVAVIAMLFMLKRFQSSS